VTQESTQPIERQAQVKFSGETKQFFSIWTVNILLTILTLGIYSAWAKVRTNRYFYSNTSIDNHRFSYHANPLQILIGRIIAVFIFILYSATVQFIPVLGLAVMLIAFFLMPYIINKSLRFQYSMTSYRNVRFGFKGNYGGAFLVFFVLPVASLFTLYLLLPWVMKKVNEYIISNITYGDREFKTELSTSEYYITALIVIALSIIGGLVFSLLSVMFAGLTGSLDGIGNLENASLASLVFMPLAVVLYGVFFSVISGIYQARIRAHIFANSEIDEIASFQSTISGKDFILLLLCNMIAIALTLGLAYPWAKIRYARYLANGTVVNIMPEADNVIDNIQQESSAVGEELAEVFDLDIAIT
jgi:uncharacterized membrane protein YjgN (DUF898 family)